MILLYLIDLLDLQGWLICVCVLLVVADVIRKRDPPNYPPGPWPLPVVGNVFTGVDFKTMEKLIEDYGDVYSLRWGNEKTVFISGYKMAKEALITQLDSFADRPIVPLFHKVFKGIGIALSNGHMWKIQKKFAFAHLRHFGEGKKTLERHIQLECQYLCDALQGEKEPFDPQFLLNNATGNVICSVIFGHRYEYTDERFQNVQRLDSEAVLLAGGVQAQLYNAFPGLFHYLPGPHQKIHENYEKITGFLRQEIEKHIEDRDPSDPRDYVDVFLGEMEKNVTDDEAGFNVETLVICTLDMVEAGTETVATTLRWGLYFMILYPEIQKKVQMEIDNVIGQSRFPSASDRPKMPYTEAVVHETQRMGNVVPLGFPKMASKDTTLGGYFIPKGTAITVNLSSVLNDKNEWETPHLFNPEHFLDAKGNFRRRDAFLPFSAGKRVCLGEQLSRMELFLMFASLLQRFSFSPVPGADPTLEGVMGFTYLPPPHKIWAKPR